MAKFYPSIFGATIMSDWIENAKIRNQFNRPDLVKITVRTKNI